MASPSLAAVLESAARLQEVMPDAVLVGDSAAAYHAGHRDSFDHDHVLPDLVERFDLVLEAIEATDGWVTNRLVPGKLILGELGDIEAGVRQLIRRRPLEVEEALLPSGRRAAFRRSRIRCASRRSWSSAATRRATSWTWLRWHFGWDRIALTSTCPGRAGPHLAHGGRPGRPRARVPPRLAADRGRRASRSLGARRPPSRRRAGRQPSVRHRRAPRARAAACTGCERAEVARRVHAQLDASGLARAPFAEAIGTSPSRPSTYLNGKVVPSAALVVRMERVAAARRPADDATATLSRAAPDPAG